MAAVNLRRGVRLFLFVERRFSFCTEELWSHLFSLEVLLTHRGWSWSPCQSGQSRFLARAQGAPARGSSRGTDQHGSSTDTAVPMWPHQHEQRERQWVDGIGPLHGPGGSGRAGWWVKPRVTQEIQPEFWGWEHLECHWGRDWCPRPSWNSSLLLIQILGLSAETANSGHLSLRPQAPFTCCWSLNSKLGW